MYQVTAALLAVLVTLSQVTGEPEERQMNLDPLGVGGSLSEGFGQLQDSLTAGFEQLRSGYQEASKVATIVGQDVSEAVQSAEPDLSANQLRRQSADLRQGAGLLEGVMRMLGVDSDKLGVMALNLLIYLAEWVTGALLGDKAAADSRSDQPLLQWLMDDNLSQVSELVQQAQLPSLPGTLIERLIDRTGNETACVQLLVCKMSPLVWGAQSAVREGFSARSADDTVLDSFYAFLPSMDDFVRYSESCEGQFPACPLLEVLENQQ